MRLYRASLVTLAVGLVSACAANPPAPQDGAPAPAEGAVVAVDEPAQPDGVEPGESDEASQLLGPAGLIGSLPQPKDGPGGAAGEASGAPGSTAPADAKPRELPPAVQLPVEPPLSSLPAGPLPAGLRPVDEQLAKGNRTAARQLLRQLVKRGQAVPIEERMHARVLLARLQQRAQPKRSAELHQQVVSEWAEPNKQLQKLEAEEPDAVRRTERIAQILDALGEAQVHLAEQERQRALKLRMPKYYGPGTEADVNRFVSTRIKTWLDDKRKALQTAEKAYTAVIKVKPRPAPRWVIVAGLRVAVMWADFVREFRAAPAPKSWGQTGPSGHGDLTWEEVNAHYRQSLVDASEAQLKMARSAAQACRDYGQRHQIDNAFSKSCEDWLKTDPR